MNKLLLMLVLISFFCFNIFSQTKPIKKKLRWTHLKQYAIIELGFNYSNTDSRLQSRTFRNEESPNPGNVFGIDISYLYYNYGKFNIGYAVALNYCNYSTQRKYAYESKSIVNDFNNDELHIIETAKISEQQKASFVELPIMFRSNYLLIDKTFLMFNTGASVYLPVKSSFTSYGPYTRKGFYPKYDLYIENSVDKPGTQLYFPSERQTLSTGTLKLDYGIALLADIGIKRVISRNISARIGYNITYGVKNINGSKPANFAISPEYNTYNTLMMRGDKISSFAYGFSFGIITDLGKQRFVRKKSNSQVPVYNK